MIRYVITMIAAGLMTAGAVSACYADTGAGRAAVHATDGIARIG